MPHVTHYIRNEALYSGTYVGGVDLSRLNVRLEKENNPFGQGAAEDRIEFMYLGVRKGNLLEGHFDLRVEHYQQGWAPGVDLVTLSFWGIGIAGAGLRDPDLLHEPDVDRYGRTYPEARLDHTNPITHYAVGVLPHALYQQSVVDPYTPMGIGPRIRPDHLKPGHFAHFVRMPLAAARFMHAQTKARSEAFLERLYNMSLPDGKATAPTPGGSTPAKP